MLKALRNSKKGQSVIEYIVVITILLFAWLGVSQYFKRGIAGRWKSVVDDLGDQYDPRVMDTSVRTTLIQNTEVFIVAINDVGGFHTTRIDYTNSVETKSGYSAVGGY